MTSPPPRVPSTRRLTLPLYAYSALTDFILLYPVYALLFAQTGLSVAQISSLFLIWALTGTLLEIPSGAWADTVSRRLLLALAPLLTGAGFTLWLLTPSYWAFAAGFVLWGVGASLASGALQALVYEELRHRGAAPSYATVMGRARAIGVAAVAAATAAAVPVLALAGYPGVGAASVLACLLCALAGAALPEHRRPRRNTASLAQDTAQETRGYTATLRAGLAEARASRPVLAALVLVIVVSAIWESLEEYVPLLAAEAGVPTAQVPLVVLVVWAGVTLGGLLSGAGARLPARMFTALLAAAAAATAAGALLANAPGWVLLAAGFGVFQMAGVVADARLQDRITGSSRATVTSLAGLGTNGAAACVLLGYAGVYAFTGHSGAFALFSLPYLVVALVLARPTRCRRPAAPSG